MTLLNNAVALLWLAASAGAFILVFRPKPNWPVAATPTRALAVFILVFVAGACLVAVTRPGDPSPPKTPPPPPPVARAVLPDPALVRAHPERYVKLTGVKADKGEAVGGKRGAVLLTGGAINTSGLPIRDLALTCALSNGAAPAAAVSTLIAATLPPGGSVIFAAVDVGRVDQPWNRWTCQVVKARVAG